MKEIEILGNAKYGTYGLVDGRLKMHGEGNRIDLSKLKGRYHVKVRTLYGTVCVNLPDAPVTTTSTTLVEAGIIDISTNYDVFWAQLDRLHYLFQSNLDSYGYSEAVVCKIVEDVNDSICISFF